MVCTGATTTTTVLAHSTGASASAPALSGDDNTTLRWASTSAISAERLASHWAASTAPAGC